MSLLLGCIADDFTGATDLASMLVRHGMRTVQYIGVPDTLEEHPEADAVVVALKSRTLPSSEAIHLSVKALTQLQAAGAEQFFFKYCSTFDSTDEGNIGPVLEALLDELESDFTVACPAAPENGRTVYKGHLFVNDTLLSESGMRNHPLTPMKDPNLVRVLGRQMKGSVGLTPYHIVQKGVKSIRRHWEILREEGHRCVLLDAIQDEHLVTLGAACADLTLITGGSGMSMGLPENFRRRGLLPESINAVASLPPIEGPAAVIAGSCSSATRSQVAAMQYTHPAYKIDPTRTEPDFVVSEAVAWAKERLNATPILIYSSAPPEEVAAIQARLGKAQASSITEHILARIAQELVNLGVHRLVVAGGETAGAVVSTLGIQALRIGPEIAPGVPWTIAITPPNVHSTPTSLCLALKSGNFGDKDFFTTAFDLYHERT